MIFLICFTDKSNVLKSAKIMFYGHAKLYKFVLTIEKKLIFTNRWWNSIYLQFRLKTSITNVWEHNFESAIPWFQMNYLKLNTDKCCLNIRKQKWIYVGKVR